MGGGIGKKFAARPWITVRNSLLSFRSGPLQTVLATRRMLNLHHAQHNFPQYLPVVVETSFPEITQKRNFRSPALL